MDKIKDIGEIEHLCRLITENIEDAILITELKLNIIYISLSVTKVLGFTLEELQKIPINNIITPESYKEVLKIVKELSLLDIAHNNNKPLFANLELEYFQKDGSTAWAELVGSLIKNKLGVPQEILFIGRNISERKKAEEEMIRLNEFNKNLLNNSPNPIVVVNADGSMKYVNPAFEKMTGFLLTEAAGIKPPFPWWAKESLAESSEFFKKALIGVENRSEIQYQTKDGRKLWVLIDVSIQKTGDEIKYFISTITDITDKKNTQDKLEYLSFHDSLTGLYNRAFFDEEIKRLGKSRKIPISVIIGDANNLKLVNDVFGHARGDELLKKIAHVLQKCCRNEDIVSRWGGDEFAIILPDTGLNIADNIIKRIKEACLNESKKKYPLSLALGAAVKDTKDDDVNIVFKIAEDNMYRRKMMERKILSRSVFSFLESTLFETGVEIDDHVTRLKKCIKKFGEHLNLSDKQFQELELLARYQDIGKVIISEIALKNLEELSEKDHKILKKHPETGCKIAQSFPDISCISEYILTHHEDWNGNGYPGNLKELSIPYISRIIAIINAYDEKLNGNFNNIAISKSKALKELKKLSGIQLDPDLLKRFIEII
jgi:diguanylate cyclase (GGDEF)-like protein/PAS domain S-box-containing protein